MIYYQIILQDKTPKRLIGFREQTIEDACKCLQIKKEDILFFEKIDDKDIEKRPKIEKGKLKYIKNKGVKNGK